MQVKLYLQPSAHIRVAKGDDVYSWDFQTIVPYSDGTWPSLDMSQHTFLADVDVVLPSPETAVPVALAQLTAKEQEVQAEAYKAVREIQEERAKLLSLTYSNTAKESFDDIPF